MQLGNAIEQTLNGYMSVQQNTRKLTNQFRAKKGGSVRRRWRRMDFEMLVEFDHYKNVEIIKLEKLKLKIEIRNF